MKKIKIYFLFLLFAGIASAQVGINTITPKATLDVVATPANLALPDGIQVPRLSREELTLKSAAYGLPQTNIILYVSDVLGGDALASRVNITKVGFYYFDGSTWQVVSTANPDWSSLGNANTDPANNFIGTTDAKDFTIRTTNVERTRVAETGQIATGALGGVLTNEEKEADLTLRSANRGLLLNRVPLISTTDAVTIGPHVAGMFVYNTAAVSDVLPGLYYNDGTKWNGVAISAYDEIWKLGNTFFTDSLHFLGTINPNSLAIRTSNLERIRVNTSQNVGIGTIAPANRLHVVSGTAGNSGVRTSLINANFLGTNASGDIISATLPAFAFGSIKYSFQASDHNGWILLNGRNANTFTPTQQSQLSNVLSISGATPIPNATDKYLSYVGAGGLATESGNANNEITLIRANLPNIKYTGTTTGVKVVDGGSAYSPTGEPGNGQNGLALVSGGGANTTTGLDTTAGEANVNVGAIRHHKHLFGIPINGNVVQQKLDITPRTLKANVFMYVGK